MIPDQRFKLRFVLFRLWFASFSLFLEKQISLTPTASSSEFRILRIEPFVLSVNLASFMTRSVSSIHQLRLGQGYRESHLRLRPVALCSSVGLSSFVISLFLMAFSSSTHVLSLLTERKKKKEGEGVIDSERQVRGRDGEKEVRDREVERQEQRKD